MKILTRLVVGVVVVTVMVVPVVAVAYAAGNPFPADLLDRLASRTIDDATIVKILSLGFYACWAWFCGPALRQVRIAASAPRPGRLHHGMATTPDRSRPTSVAEPLAGPRGWLAGLSRFAITGAIAASTVTAVAPRPSAAAPITEIAAPVAAADAVAPVTAAPAAAVEVTSVMASHRDTPYAIARRYSPPDRVDAVRDAIVELNVGRPMPDGTPYRGGGFPAGWNVAIPAGATTADSKPSATHTAAADESLPGEATNDHLPQDIDATARVADDPAAAEATVTVAEDDNLWILAVARHEQAGATPTPAVIAAYVAEVATVNADQIEDPNLIYPGQRLVMPSIAPTVTSPPSTPSATAAEGMEPVVHVFEPGDTLWDVLQDFHGHVDADVVWDTAERAGIEDPSNIAVGTAVTIGWRPVSAAAPTPTAAPTATPDPAPTVEPAPTTPSPTTVPPLPTPAPTSTSRPVVKTTPASPPTLEGAPAPTPTTTVAPPTTDGLFDWSPRSVWPSLPIGLLLAAGLAGTTRRLRGRRLSRVQPGEQVAAPPAVAAGTELAVSSGRPDVRLSTLQSLLRTVTPHAREQADPPAVRSVELADDRVEVLFTAPAPYPPAGWTTINGGRSWVHRFADVPESPVRQLVTPALVTLGLRPGGGEVLLDLETAGSLAIVGDLDVALGMARAITLELATYPLGVAMDVCLIGFDLDGAELCDRTWKDTTLIRAVRVARETLERTTATGAASLIAARAATDDDEGLLDPQIFVVDAAAVEDGDVALLDELIGLCTPQSGAAVVVVGDHPAARERVTVQSADVATWSGATLRPTPLNREAVAQVAVMFDHAANAPAEPLAPSPTVADLLDTNDDGTVAGPNGNGDGPRPTGGPVVDVDDDPVAPYRYSPPEFDVLIRVLGDVTVEGRPITSGVDVEMLTLLAFKRDQPPNVDTLRFLLEKRRRRNDSDNGHPILHDAQWDEAATESAVKTLRNRASALRRNLGVGSDGEDLLPPAGKAGTKGRYRLSPRVLTDIDLIEHRYHTATGLPSGDALPLLRDGLSLFAGPAFRGGGAGYAWIAPEGVLTRITNVVNAYATLLMQLAFDVDDIALVLQTAAAAGRVIDDPVALLPMCEVQRQFAEASGDPDLTAAVLQAHRRLLAHAEDYDPLAGT